MKRTSRDREDGDVEIVRPVDDPSSPRSNGRSSPMRSLHRSVGNQNVQGFHELGNYAVSDASIQNTDWDFQMYGPASKPGQTNHEQHKRTQLHGQAPTTMEVKKWETLQGTSIIEVMSETFEEEGLPTE